MQGLAHAAGDLGTLFIPNLAWWWSRPRWLAGWNPWIFAGYPSNADPQIGQLHPFGLVWAIASPLTAAALDGVLTPVAAGIGMLLYLRTIGCGRTGSVVGALAFALGGFIGAQASHPAHSRAALAVPWALAAIEGLEGAALVAGLGAATAAIVVGGHPQLVAYGLGVVGAYALWLGRPAARGRALALGAGLALGVAAGARSWLPALQLIGQSTHGFAASADAGETAGRLSGIHLAGILVPFAAGGGRGPLYGSAPESLACPVTECGAYPGLLVWLAVLAAAPALFRDPRGRFWLAVGAAGLVLASGIVGVLPPFAEVRAPARFVLWFSVAAAAAAGLALRDAPPRAGPWLAAALVLAVTIAGIGLLGPKASRAARGSLALLAVVGLVACIRPGRGGAWLVAVAAVDLIAFAVSVPVGVPPEAVRGTTSVLRVLHEVAGEPHLDRAMVVPFFGGPNWAALDETPLVQGYNALVLRSLAALLGHDPATRAIEVGWIMDPRLAAESNHVLDLLRCGTVGALRWADDPLAQAIAADGVRWQAIGEREGVRVYRNRRVRPVAWLVHRARVVEPGAALRLVRGVEGHFDPAAEALIDRPVDGLAAAPAAEPPVAVVSHAEDEIRLAAEAAAPALLVTSELFYPGWTATVDGRPADVLEVNAGFRAVALPPGRHDVRLAYRPPLVRLGLGATLASLVLLAAFAVHGRRRARHDESLVAVPAAQRRRRSP